MKAVIVSRHAAAIEFCREFCKAQDLKEVDVKDHIEKQDIESYDIFIGILPIQYIFEIEKKGKAAFALILPSVPKELRGKELTIEQMKEFGARIVRVGLKKTCRHGKEISFNRCLPCSLCGDNQEIELTLVEVF